MLSDDELRDACREMMRAKLMTQQGLATACSVSQGHISKVLAGKVAMTGRTRDAVQRLIATLAAPVDIEASLQVALHDLLVIATPRQRMHILHILQELTAVIKARA